MTIENKQTESQTKDKHNIEDTKSSQEYDNSIGYNGEKKTALDLEIERELLEMMENKDLNRKREERYKNCWTTICPCYCYFSYCAFYPSYVINKAKE